SGTTMRMLSGLLVAQHFGTRLVGDASLSRRPMRRVIDPLRARGGHIAGVAGKKPGEMYPPLSIAPLVEGERLRPFQYEMPVASAQVKSALLLSGLYAAGPTAISEPTLSRDHTERMLMALGVPLDTAGPAVILHVDEWNRRWDGFEWHVPGDPSSAAFVAAAAAIVEGSDVTLEGVCTNPTRTGFFEALDEMGARGGVVPKGDAAGGEPVGDIHVLASSLVARSVGGERITRMIDEVPILVAMAARAKGVTEVRDAAELRVKESDRIATMAKVLAAFGIECEELDDGMRVHGGVPRGAHVQSDDDHRIAMSAAVLALVAEGETIIDDVECVETSFPGFAALFRSLGADITEETVEEHA
ncbi:MAG: 3-phosphoshikimate 1-carboxyvinyltransferase, partial [Myxococcales bacterium]|nr:3-phosphoshikimate 1-carboxyvinyltransferase [Myxococcales bacterium]